jgi:hypothetical protein
MIKRGRAHPQNGGDFLHTDGMLRKLAITYNPRRLFPRWTRRGISPSHLAEAELLSQVIGGCGDVWCNFHQPVAMRPVDLTRQLSWRDRLSFRRHLMCLPFDQTSICLDSDFQREW